MLTLLMASVGARAQDIIVKKDGSTITSKVLKITANEIEYKKFTNQDGPTYTVEKSEVLSINYENGERDTFSQTTSTTTTDTPPQPSTFDPTIMKSDSELLAMVNKDLSSVKSAKAKQLRKIAWIGGGIFVAGGLTLFYLDSEEYADCIGYAAACSGAGVVWTASFLAAAHHHQKKAENAIFVMQSMPILQQEFNMTEHSSLMVGIDALRDNFQHSNAYGIGVRYHF